MDKNYFIAHLRGAEKDINDADTSLVNVDGFRHYSQFLTSDEEKSKQPKPTNGIVYNANVMVHHLDVEKQEIHEQLTKNLKQFKNSSPLGFFVLSKECIDSDDYKEFYTKITNLMEQTGHCFLDVNDNSFYRLAKDEIINEHFHIYVYDVTIGGQDMKWFKAYYVDWADYVEIDIHKLLLMSKIEFRNERPATYKDFY